LLRNRILRLKFGYSPTFTAKLLLFKLDEICAYMQLAKKQHVSQILEIRMLDKGQQTYTACWTCPGQTVSPHLSNQCKCHWKKI